MKKLYTLLATLITVIAIQAQITVTDATFPSAGDTLRTATDLNPSPNDGYLTNPGGPQNWDFSNLVASTRQETIFRPASEGMAIADFPGASLVTTLPGDQIETYYAVSSTNFDNLGYSAPEFTGIPVDAIFKFTPPLTERLAPMNFFDVNPFNTNATFAISLAEIPSEILDSLGIPVGLADSVRVRVAMNIIEVVDAYGVLTIPGGTYDVLRKKRTNYRSTFIDLHTLFLGWQDITGLLGGFGDFGLDTINSIDFYSNTEKEVIASITTDVSDAIQQITFKDNGVMSSTANNLSILTPEVVISPNPASSTAIFIMKNFTPGEYTLRVFNSAGNLVQTQHVSYTGDEVSFQGIESGMYFYQLTDTKNRMIAVGKIEILRY